jgi:hypothetical protein
VVRFTPRSLYFLGKNPRYSLGRRLFGPQSWPGHSDEGKDERGSITGTGSEGVLFSFTLGWKWKEIHKLLIRDLK